MRILLFSNNFIDYTLQFAKELENSGNSVQILMPRESGIELKIPILQNLKIIEYENPRLYSPKILILLLFFLKHIKKFSPNIIHCQGSYLWFFLIIPILKIKKIVLVTTIHDPIPHEGENYIRTRFANFCSRLFSDDIFVHGEILKNKMITKYHYPYQKVHSIIIGEHQVDPFLQYNDKIDEEDNTILFFGRIYDYKGLEYLIKSESIISKQISNLKIIIAGHGKKFEEYRKLINNNTHFEIKNYRISYREGAQLFRKCSIVILPYTDASQSGVIPTAYGFKKPVIVTRVGSIPEIVDDGITGIIVPPKDVEKLANAIIWLLKNKKERLQMGLNGYHKLKSDMAWKNIVKDILIIYEARLKR